MTAFEAYRLKLAKLKADTDKVAETNWAYWRDAYSEENFDMLRLT